MWLEIVCPNETVGPELYRGEILRMTKEQCLLVGFVSPHNGSHWRRAERVVR